MTLEGFKPHDPAAAKLYLEKGWWLGMTMGDIFDKTCDLYPEREALVGAGQRYTYGELRQRVDRLAYAFLQQGLKPGDRVLLQLPNWPEFVVSYFALQKAGLIMVLLTVNHSAQEIGHLAKLSQPRGWILPSAYKKMDFGGLIASVRKGNPDLATVMVMGSPPEGCLDLAELMEGSAEEGEVRAALEEARPSPFEVCQILPSGGTTGLPKGAPRSHNDYICNVEYTSRAWFLSPADNCLVGTTVGHNLALLVTVTGAVFQGAKIVLIDSTRPEAILQAIQDERITCTGLVPTLMSRVVKYEDLRKFDVSSLRRVYVGAANSPAEVVKGAEERLGCRYINAFGMVEGPCAQTRPYHGLEVRASTIGRPVCPYDRIITLDPLGQPTPLGVEGELAAKGPGIFTGYFKNPQANASSFTPDGFFRTGDLAVIDEKGFIRITDRIKDIIIRGGENIAARDVEELVSSHPQVEYTAVVCMPDPDLGEAVCAYAKVVNGSKLTYDDLVQHLIAQGASKVLIPARIEFIKELPLTAAGKADKKVLRRDILEKLRQETASVS